VLDLKDSSGQKLPARDVLFLLLHLASHAVSDTGTSSEGRYYDADFADAAAKLGLEVSAIRRPGIGYQPEGLARGTLTSYRDVIRALDRAMAKWDPATVRKRSRSPLPYICSCVPPRRVWTYAGVADRGPVSCGVCGQEFLLQRPS
jgi:hypothetical protein